MIDFWFKVPNFAGGDDKELWQCAAAPAGKGRQGSIFNLFVQTVRFVNDLLKSCFRFSQEQAVAQ